jgi:hypothetical protein
MMANAETEDVMMDENVRASILLLGDSWAEHGASAAQAALLASRPWWDVVRGPDLLPWEGMLGGVRVAGATWRHAGLWYAAGDPTWPVARGAGAEPLAEAWRAAGAQPVRLLSRAAVRRLCRAGAARRGCHLDPADLASDEIVAAWAQALGLPW